MKFQIVSDLHLEFNLNVSIPNTGADVLCLVGDTCLARHLRRYLIDKHLNNAEDQENANRYFEFFDHISKQFDRVIYIIGNHEHYSGRWDDTANWIREALAPWPNITLLDNNWIDLGNIRVIGTTLWTNLNQQDPLTMLSIKNMMNDYHAITIKNGNAYHKLRPIDTVLANEKAVQTIKTGSEQWAGDIVVLGHHPPSRISIHPKYSDQKIMNDAYCNNLDEYIISQPNIKLWCCGHVHHRHWYYLGSTLVVCNPYGYPNEIPKPYQNIVIDTDGMPDPTTVKLNHYL